MSMLRVLLLIILIFAGCGYLAASILKMAAQEILKIKLTLGEAFVTVVSAASLVICLSSSSLNRLRGEPDQTHLVLLSWALVLLIQSGVISHRHALKFAVGMGAMAVVNVWAVIEIVAVPAFLTWYS